MLFSSMIGFVLTQKFDTERRVTAYNNFMQDLVKLVIDKYDGSLKAEHGTGRNMAGRRECKTGRPGSV